MLCTIIKRLILYLGIYISYLYEEEFVFLDSDFTMCFYKYK